MKYTTKMIMMPEQALSQINHVQQKKDGIEGQVFEFKTALQKILSDDSLTPETQMQLYNQLFTRYLKLDTDLKAPTTVIIHKDNHESEKEKEDNVINHNQLFQEKWKDAIFQKMPKVHKDKARELIDFLNKSKQVRILDSGEVSIKDTLLPKSNIVNLVHDIVRDRPKVPGPLGYKNFLMFLKDLNVPKDLVGNPSRWNMIKEDFHTPDSKTPKTKVKRKLQYGDQNGSGFAKKMRHKYLSW